MANQKIQIGKLKFLQVILVNEIAVLICFLLSTKSQKKEIMKMFLFLSLQQSPWSACKDSGYCTRGGTYLPGDPFAWTHVPNLARVKSGRTNLANSVLLGYKRSQKRLWGKDSATQIDGSTCKKKIVGNNFCRLSYIWTSLRHHFSGVKKKKYMHIRVVLVCKISSVTF